MQSETWQRLFALETRDAVASWHRKLFGRELSARRVLEITSAARQAREFFRNAAGANDSVRPLLGFYGVASLSRAGLLLLKPGTGEASLTAGHGLSTVNWGNVLSGEISNGLSALEDLQIETCSGLFNDFITQTNNQVCMHVRSSAVDWRLSYEVPAVGMRVSLKDILARLPDLSSHLPPTIHSLNASVNSMDYSNEKGFTAKIIATQFAGIANCFTSIGYTTSEEGNLIVLKAESGKFSEQLPQFVHEYVKKTFGSIPSLCIAPPFGSTRYSQLAMLYMLSYILGMLTRYFPAQWVSLASGAKGDGIWPTINAGQKCIEASFPELMLELILDRVEESGRA